MKALDRESLNKSLAFQIFDAQGKRVQAKSLAAGAGLLWTWNGTGFNGQKLSNGVYLVKFMAGSSLVDQQKVMILR